MWFLGEDMETENEKLLNRKEELLRRQEALEARIKQRKDKIDVGDLNKLNEECRILKVS